MPGPDRTPELMLGTLALKAGYITKPQLDACLREQEAARARKQNLPLGQLLVRKGYIKEKSVLFLLQNHQYVDQRCEDKLFGQIAVANGFLTQEKLDECLDRQRDLYFDQRKVKRIGEILVERKLLTRQQMEAVIQVQSRMRGAPSPPSAPPEQDPNSETVVQIGWATPPPGTLNVPEARPLPQPRAAQPPPPRTSRTGSSRFRRPDGGTTRKRR